MSYRQKKKAAKVLRWCAFKNVNFGIEYRVCETVRKGSV